MPIAAGAFFGPGGAFGAEGLFGGALETGLAVGAATGLLTGNPLQGVMAGMGAYGGSNLYNTMANAGEGVTKSVVDTAANEAKNLAAAGKQLTPQQLALANPEGARMAAVANAPSANQAFVPPAANIAAPVAPDIAPIAPDFSIQAAKAAGMGGYTPGAEFTPSTYGPQTVSYELNGKPATATFDSAPYASASNNYGLDTLNPAPEMSKFDYAMKGLKQLPTSEGWNAYKAAGGSGGQLAMAAAGPILGGLEPSDIYGKPITGGTEDKYDPNARLYLGADTGLRFPQTAYMAAGGLAELSANMQNQQQPQQNQSFVQPNYSASTSAAMGMPQQVQQQDQQQQQDQTRLPIGSLDANTQVKPTSLISKPTYVTQGNISNSSFADGGLTSLYTRPDNPYVPPISQEGYGLARLNNLAQQGAGYARGGYLDGPGDGMSDSIPATIEGKQPARLADGEFVVPADVVSHLGNGSTKAGSQRLYSMLDKVRKARTGTAKQGKQINPNKYMPA